MMIEPEVARSAVATKMATYKLKAYYTSARASTQPQAPPQAEPRTQVKPRRVCRCPKGQEESQHMPCGHKSHQPCGCLVCPLCLGVIFH